MKDKKTVFTTSRVEEEADVAWIDRYPLGNRPITIGTSAECDIMLSDPSVSRRHARLTKMRGQWFVEDLGSTNGTFLAGQRVFLRRALHPPQRFVVGATVFQYETNQLAYGRPMATGIHAREVLKLVPRSRHEMEEEQRGGAGKSTESPTTKTLLNDVTVTVERGQFVAIIGSSGSGKSTLLRVLAGRDRDFDGNVCYDGKPVEDVAEAYRPRVGFVPQSTIAHGGLTVEEALRFSDRLSLAENTADNNIDTRVERARAQAELAPGDCSKRISTLSGGERKRACLATELLRDLKLLFLDEVTSGLDPGTEAVVMRRLRELADSGATVLLVTHQPHSLDHCHKILFMQKGEMLFSLPPREITKLLCSNDFSQLYRPEAAPTLRRLMRRSKELARNDHKPEPTDIRPRASKRWSLGGMRARTVQGARQFWWLTLRHLLLLRRDLVTTAFLAIGAPVILSRLLCVLTNSMPGPDAPPTGGVEQLQDWVQYMRQVQMQSFGGVLTVLFLGLFATVQAIVKERDIYEQEHFRGVGVLPYTASKMLPLGLLGLLQVASVFLVLNSVGTISVVSTSDQLVLLSATSVVAVLAGLALSAAIPKPPREVELDGTTLAIMAMNVLVIPQILFTSAFVPLEGLAEWLANVLITSNVAYEGLDSLIRTGITARAPEVLSAIDKLPSMSSGPQYDLGHYLKVLTIHGGLALGALLFAMRAKGRQRTRYSSELKRQTKVDKTEGARMRERLTKTAAIIVVSSFSLVALLPLERWWKEDNRPPRALPGTTSVSAATDPALTPSAPEVLIIAPASTEKAAQSAGTTKK